MSYLCVPAKTWDRWAPCVRSPQLRQPWLTWGEVANSQREVEGKGPYLFALQQSKGHWTVSVCPVGLQSAVKSLAHCFQLIFLTQLNSWLLSQRSTWYPDSHFSIRYDHIFNKQNSARHSRRCQRHKLKYNDARHSPLATGEQEDVSEALKESDKEMLQ